MNGAKPAFVEVKPAIVAWSHSCVRPSHMERLYSLSWYLGYNNSLYPCQASWPGLGEALYQFAEQVILILGILIRMQGTGHHPRRPQRINLILHQCNEGRHHQRQSTGDQRRHLIAQRLSTASGHHEQ